MNKWIKLFNMYPWFEVNQQLIRAQSQCIISGLGTCFGKPGEPRRPLGCIREWRSRARRWAPQLQLIPFSLDRAAAAFAKASPRVWCPRPWKLRPAHALPPTKRGLFNTYLASARALPGGLAASIPCAHLWVWAWLLARDGWRRCPSQHPATRRDGPAHEQSWIGAH